jgi:CBS domain-containing protein
MPTAQDILARKGSLVYSISPDATVLEATNRMNHHKIGALMVMNDGQMVGIFTERDVLRRVVGHELSPAKVKVFDVMTADLVTCTPTTDMEDIAEIMRSRRIRHVPVLDNDGVLLGLISIGDINAHNAQRRDSELQFLNEYVYGRA